MPLDRYVGRTPAKDEEATLITVPLRMNLRFKKLLLNASAASGSIRVAVLEGDQPIAGLGLQECQQISGDGLRLPVVWQDVDHTGQKLAALEGKLIRLEFRIQRASLFSFGFAVGASSPAKVKDKP
jgi:hypothetical protein